MSNFQFNSIMSVAWLSVLMQVDSVAMAAVCLAFVLFFSGAAIYARCKGI